MPFVLLIAGEMLFVSAIKGTQQDLFNLVEDDFTGTGSFIYWLAAIAFVGALGYVPQLKAFSNAFLVLILVVLIIHQDPSKLFGSITSALQSSATPSVPITPSAGTQATNDNSVASPNLGKEIQNLGTIANSLSGLFQ